MGATQDAIEVKEGTSLDVLVRDIAALDRVIDTWEPEKRNTITAFKGAIDALHREALVRLIRGMRGDPSAAKALRQVAEDEVVYAVLRHHELVRPSLVERVEEALESVRPSLQEHGGDVELLRVLPPSAVEVQFIGACESCPASALTFTQGVEKAIAEHCPEITDVRQVKKTGASPSRNAGLLEIVSPFSRAASESWISLGPVLDLPNQELVRQKIEGHRILLWRSGLQLTCYDDSCAHLGLSFDGAAPKEDAILVCPHHGFEYSLLTGECLTVSEVQLSQRTIDVEDGVAFVQLGDQP